MIAPELRSRIRRLFFGEHWKIGTIAAELGVHRDAVEHAIERERFINVAYRPRASCLDAYKDFVRATLEEHPRLRSTRLLEMIRQRGYAGTVWTLRRFVACSRPSGSREAFFRLSVLPGEQAQVDWGHFGTIARRLDAQGAVVLRDGSCVLARDLRLLRASTRRRRASCGVTSPRSRTSVACRGPLLYDNLKSVVLEREGDRHPVPPSRSWISRGTTTSTPFPSRVARGNEKGRVERAIRYLRESFFAASALP
ncbi:MAG: hypothetical protein V9G29_19405 [Burkholderiaceae bacterium]